jgi:tetratricopeptide (TPR) repeat protein
MKCRVAYSGFLVLLAAVSVVDGQVGGRLGRGTRPVSSTRSGRSGLIRSPNPIDTSTNLVITGNVGGGRHFRGVVPYRAPTDFGALTPSSSLDSFLRRASGSGIGQYSSTYQPFYSATRTVTTMRPGISGAAGPSLADVSAKGQRGYVSGPLPSEVLQYGGGGAVPARRLEGMYSYFGADRAMGRPTSMGRGRVERMIASEADRYQRDWMLTAEQRRLQAEQLRGVLKEVEEAAKIGRVTSIAQKSLAETEKEGGKEGAGLRIEPTQTKTDAEKETAESPFFAMTGPKGKLDVYEQMKWQVFALERSVESPAAGKSQEAGEGDKELSKEATEGEERTGRQRRSETKSPVERLSGAELAARAKSILGPHETFASYSEDKFNEHVRAAERYLKEGKYYRAADAYTLASIYKPDDPLAYAGKSHALFAAGEYMSSALFLARALEIFPEYARFKVDIEAMLGDRDVLEGRIADVRERLVSVDAPELHFLLAYVYHQMGRADWAKAEISAAYEKMPDSAAVVTLKEAIEAAG